LEGSDLSAFLALSSVSCGGWNTPFERAQEGVKILLPGKQAPAQKQAFPLAPKHGRRSAVPAEHNR
jgi:hypothetical protein